MSDDDTIRLRAACAEVELEVRGEGEADEVTDDLLVVFYAGDDQAPVPVADIRRHGAYTVMVRAAPTPVQMLAASRSGYSFVLTSPLRVERVASMLRYLRDVAAPVPTQILRLDGEDQLSTASKSIRLNPDEGAALRRLGREPGRIVLREELRLVLDGDDPLPVINGLRQRIQQIGSAAQILNVPHLGFRLAGSVRIGR